MEKRRFYKVNFYFSDINAILKRIFFPDVTEKCNRPNWMCMPTMGDPISNAFNRPVFFFSKTHSQTFFPGNGHPQNKPPIFIAYSGSHFVFFQLIINALAIQTDLEVADEPLALEWKTKYAKCFELSDTLKALANFPDEYKHY